LLEEIIKIQFGFLHLKSGAIARFNPDHVQSWEEHLPDLILIMYKAERSICPI